MKIPFSCLLFLLSFLSYAQIEINFSYSEPTSPQNKPIQVIELMLKSRLADMGHQLGINLEGRFGSIKVAKERNFRYGISASLTTVNTPLLLELGGGYLTLQQFIFGEKELHTKDYGGHLQFIGYLGIGFPINKKLKIGYRFEHMSNGSMYSSNPALDTHAFILGFRF